jgi:tRNA(Ile)-lysidine synthase TilS/MesJ
MIRIIGKIPHKVTIACSAGVDSMAFTQFLQRGKREVDLAFFNHDTLHSKNAQAYASKE